MQRYYCEENCYWWIRIYRSKVVEVLLSRGNDVFVLDISGDQEMCDNRFGKFSVTHQYCNILNIELLKELFRGADAVYNFAGVLGTSELNSNSTSAVNINIIGALNVFDACITTNVPSVFYPSKPNVWLNTYSITKFASEQFTQLYNKQKTINISSLRLFNVYGCGQHLYPIRKIVPTFALQAMLGIPLQIYGSGEQTVDMINVIDVASLSVRVVECGITEIIECGRGIPVTVNQVANFINDYFDNKGIEYLPMREGEIEDTKLVADLTRFRNYFPNYQFSDYKTSLEETLEYYTCLSTEEINKALCFFSFQQ